MSTAIPLQSLTLRHRAPSTPDDHPSPQATSPSSPRPFTFTPTSTYWITPHGPLTKTIPILDLTADISTPSPDPSSATHKAAVQRALKDHSYTPTWTCHRKTWLGLRYTITNAQDEPVAEWAHPWSSVGTATLTFPDPERHPISLRPKHFLLRTETFTLDSVPYVWEMDSLWHSTNMTLYRVRGEEKEVVARYAQKWWGSFVTGGTIVVGEEGMDMVACLTAVVVLKKKRQRAGERKGGE